MNQAIAHTVLYIFMLALEEQNHKTGQTCFYGCITAFVNVTILLLTLLTINQVKKLALNQSPSLFVEKILMVILKASMAFIDLSVSHHLILINDAIHHSPVLW